MPPSHIKLLTPDPDLPTNHHGPPNTAKVALTDQPPIPRYFQNPWPSYRMPGFSDAYTAYRKGAAIAIPPPIKPRKFDDPDDCDDFDGEEYLDTGVSRTEAGYILPGTYIPPQFTKIHIEDEASDWREPPVDVVEPHWGSNQQDRENVTWLGHASVLVRLPWKNESKDDMCGVLFDPIFSARCSPTQYFGPSRYVDPPCSVSDLPPIHLCLISHDHYDHLDYYTILDLWKYNLNTIHFVVPLGLKEWLEGCNIPSSQITELDWWHEVIFQFSANSQLNSADQDDDGENDFDTDLSTEGALTLKVACTPSQHRSGRGLFDHCKSLWSSWCVGIVEQEDMDKVENRGMKDWKGFKMFFGGDTGYRYATAPEGDSDAICPAFQQIADQYAPFTFSLLPLSTGSSLPFLRSLLSLSLDQYTLTSSNHCSPSDSMEIHRIVQSERTLGMHWGTFCDSDEARGTRVEFGRMRRQMGLGKVWEDDTKGEEQGKKNNSNYNGRFVIADIGETLVFPPRSRGT